MTATRAALMHMNSFIPTARALATRIAACSSMILPVSMCESLNSARKSEVMTRTASRMAVSPWREKAVEANAGPEAVPTAARNIIRPSCRSV